MSAKDWSEMKTFTVSDFARSPAKVLAAADCNGVAQIESRSGRAYSLKPEVAAVRAKLDWAAFVRKRRASLKKHFPDGPIMTLRRARRFDRLLADDGRLL